MPFPQLIEMHNRVVHHTPSGGFIEITWYVEPAAAAPPVIQALMGWVDTSVNPSYEARVLPAHDIEYDYYFCDDVQQIPFDMAQVSFRESTQYTLPSLNGVRTALEHKSNPVHGVGYEIQRPGNSAHTAGAYLVARYRPLFSAYTGDNKKLAWDYLNVKFEPQERTNKINLGLRILSWQPGGLGAFFTKYQDAGLNPELPEAFLRMTIERKMISPKFDFQVLQRRIGHVNKTMLRGGDLAGTDLSLPQRPPETVWFKSYELDEMRTPAVNEDGDPDGFNRWYNIRLHFNVRKLLAGATYGRDGIKSPAGGVVTWNQMLVFPGVQNETMARLAGVEQGLGWYYVGYAASPGLLGGDLAKPENNQFVIDNLRPLFEAQRE